MIFRPFYRFETGCAAYVFGCGGQGICCVVDPHEADVDAYSELAEAKVMRIACVFGTGARYALHRNADLAFLLGLDRDAFVDKVATDVPGKPADMESILRFNQGRAA